MRATLVVLLAAVASACAAPVGGDGVGEDGGSLCPACGRPVEGGDVSAESRVFIEVSAKAAVNGKYGRLLRTIHAPDDLGPYGEFKDFGRWEGSSYAGQTDLPPGYWVYVFPDWYIWASIEEHPAPGR